MKVRGIRARINRIRPKGYTFSFYAKRTGEAQWTRYEQVTHRHAFVQGQRGHHCRSRGGADEGRHQTGDCVLEKLNPWHPITDSVDLKHLGKLGEETGELTSATLRCIIQGIDEVEPVTKKSNRLWLEEEIADVEANIELVKRRFGLRRDFIVIRREEKIARLHTWHAMA